MITTANCKDMVDLLRQDEYINDMIDIEIDSKMSVSTLYTLETIFYLRLQLAQVSWDKNAILYEDICLDRFEQISKVLTEKYGNTQSINEKIEMLERIEAISLDINNEHSLFALEEASIIEDEPNLTYAQKLRLKWLPGITLADESKIVAELLSQRTGSFEMATIALIIDFITDDERDAVIDRYIAMVDAAIESDDTAELGSLLALAAYWNSNPDVRFRLTEIPEKIASIEGLPLPEKRVNAIADEIYSRIDAITGKYSCVEEIPA